MYKSRSKLMMLAKGPSQDGGDLRPGRRQPVTRADNAIGQKIGPCFSGLVPVIPSCDSSPVPLPLG